MSTLWLVVDNNGLAEKFKSVCTMEENYINFKPSPHLTYTHRFSQLMNVEYVK